MYQSTRFSASSATGKWPDLAVEMVIFNKLSVAAAKSAKMRLLQQRF
jgi:hypothetical protein